MKRLVPALLFAFAAATGCAHGDERAPGVGGAQVGPPEEVLAMHDLSLSLVAPEAPVLSGENFAAEVTVANMSGGPVEAPADIGDDAFVFRLRSLDGGADIAMSRDALSRKSAADPVEQLLPQLTGLRQTLGAGEARSIAVYPARLTTSPIPPGRYAFTVEMLDGSAAASAPAPLTVVAAHIVAQRVSGAVGFDAPKVAFVHEDDGALTLFGGEGTAEGPIWSAGLRLGPIEGPAATLSLALAMRDDGEPGALVAGWLRDGAFSAVVARSAYVVAAIGPLGLGLEDATLSPVGWDTGPSAVAASFVAMGTGPQGVELALIDFGAADGWAAAVRRVAMPFAEAPAIWRASRGADGAMTILAAFAAEGGGVVRRVAVQADGTAGPAEDALATEGPIVALSAPYARSEDGVAQALSMAGMLETRARMAVNFIPLDAAEPRERRFLVPLVDGAAPTGWSLAEGAPAPALLGAVSGDAILGLRVGNETEGVVLARDLKEVADLTAIAIGPQGWAVWRDEAGMMRQAAFPR